jgi:hypothetical protein
MRESTFLIVTLGDSIQFLGQLDICQTFRGADGRWTGLVANLRDHELLMSVCSPNEQVKWSRKTTMRVRGIGCCAGMNYP